MLRTVIFASERSNATRAIVCPSASSARNDGCVALEGGERLVLDRIEQPSGYLDELIESWSLVILFRTEGAEHENGRHGTLGRRRRAQAWPAV